MFGLPIAKTKSSGRKAIVTECASYRMRDWSGQVKYADAGSKKIGPGTHRRRAGNNSLFRWRNHSNGSCTVSGKNAQAALSFFAIAALIVSVAAPASAQPTASIKGTVTDASGAVVAGAKSQSKTRRSESHGRRRPMNRATTRFRRFRRGTTMWKSARTAFQKTASQFRLIAVSTKLSSEFFPKRRKHKRRLGVESTQPVIDATTITVGQVIDKAVVQEIPLNGRQLSSTSRYCVPGTVTPPQNGFLTRLYGQGSFAFNSAGGREDAVNFMITASNLNDMVQNQVTFQPTIKHRLRIQDRQRRRTAPNTAATPVRS